MRRGRAEDGIAHSMNRRQNERDRQTPESARRRRVAILALALHTLLSAGTYLAAKGTLQTLDPLHVALFRFVTATGIMTALALPMRSFRALAREKRLIGLGLLTVPLNQLLFLEGIQLSTPTHAALLYSLTPGTVFALSLALRTEPFDRLRAAGLLAALAGVLWVLAERGLDLSRGPLRGDLLIFGAMVSWSVFSVLAKPLVARHGAIPVTAWTFIWGTAAFLPLGLWSIRSLDPSSVTPAAWGGILYLAILTSVVAYFLWSWCLKRLDATQVAIFTDLQVPLTAALSGWLFHEAMTRALVYGGLVTLAGVTLTVLRPGGSGKASHPRPSDPNPRVLRARSPASRGFSRRRRTE